MLNQNNRRAKFIVHIKNKAAHVLFFFHIHPRHRLIKQQQLGISCQGAGQFNALFQTVGQAANGCFADVLNFKKINDTLHHGAIFCLFTFGFSIPNRLA